MTVQNQESMVVRLKAEILEWMPGDVEKAHAMADRIAHNLNLDNIQVDPFGDLAQEIYEINVANGWYDSERSFGDCIALLHTEVSEAYEAYRQWGLDDMTQQIYETRSDLSSPKPEGVGSEFADVFIRLLDTSRRHGIDLYVETVRKIAFNRTRGYRHGNKRV